MEHAATTRMAMLHLSGAALAVLSAVSPAVSAAPAAAPPTALLAEFWPSPAVGVDSPQPRFSWTLSSTERGVSSAAYQVVVSDGAAVAWDSGKVEGDASNQVECGKLLKPDTRYEWKVRWWPKGSGASSSPSSPSEYSAPALLQTGLQTKADWHGAVPIDSAVEPPPPPPAPHPSPAPASDPCAQAGACQMVSTKGLKGGDGYFAGHFNVTQAHAVKDIPGCIAACMADAACVQITWAPSHSDKCVMYESISNQYTGTASLGVQGWLKLAGEFVHPKNGCPVAGYPQGCVWFVPYGSDTKHFVSVRRSLFLARHEPPFFCPALSN